jgi:hypothetical protein
MIVSGSNACVLVVKEEEEGHVRLVAILPRTQEMLRPANGDSLFFLPRGFARRETVRRTLAAPGDELATVLDELARHLEELLCLVHCEGCVVCV